MTTRPAQIGIDNQNFRAGLRKTIAYSRASWFSRAAGGAGQHMSRRLARSESKGAERSARSLCTYGQWMLLEDVVGDAVAGRLPLSFLADPVLWKRSIGGFLLAEALKVRDHR